MKHRFLAKLDKITWDTGLVWFLILIEACSNKNMFCEQYTMPKYIMISTKPYLLTPIPVLDWGKKWKFITLNHNEKKKTLENYLPNNHVGNLNDGVFFWFRKDSLPARAFDIKTEYSERSDICPLSLRCMGNKIIPGNVHLNLASSYRTFNSCNHQQHNLFHLC